MQMIKAVIFDMDGVIVESEQMHIVAEQQTLLKYGVHISAEELHTYTGTTAKFMFNKLIRKYGLDTTFEKIFGEKEEVLFRLLDEGVRPTKGVIDLLLRLKRKKVKLAIASSSHRRMISYVLGKLEIADLFDSVVGAEDVTNGKPDPEIFLTCAKQLDLRPEECLVVEDSKLGVEAAKKAGMRCLGFINPSSGDQDLSKADSVTNDFRRLNLQKLLA